MVKHLKVYKDAGTTAEIPCMSLDHTLTKQLEPFVDADGTVNWADDNRYIQTVTVTGPVTRATMETLLATTKIVMGATYPKIEVYNKSTADYYNTYSPVQFTSIECRMIGDDEWQVTCTFQW